MEKFYFDTEETVAKWYFGNRQLYLHLIGVLAVHWASSPVTMIIIGESECEWTFDQTYSCQHTDTRDIAICWDLPWYAYPVIKSADGPTLPISIVFAPSLTT